MYRFAPIDVFKSYEDFRDNFTVAVSGRFNFAFDVVDEIAAEDPGRLAMVWCDDRKREFRFTMGDIAEASARAARFFRRRGIRKGDAVMLMLRRHHAYWTAVIGLHKLGAIAIPATSLLTAEDISYRIKAINVKMIVAIGEPPVMAAVEAATQGSEATTIAVVDPPEVATPSAPWIDFEAECAAEEPVFPRPEGDALACDHDPMLVYFTSGTSSYPKMVVHGHLYPLGHIVTARHWLQCRPGGLHFTLAETGWGKASWGKLYGQWLSGCAVLTYDFARFSAKRILEVSARYRATSFCAPPTVYRHLVREPMERYDLSALEAAASAGESLNPEVFERFKEATGLEIHEGYGQTEATLMAGVFPGMEVRPGSIGKPSPGYDLDILDPEGRP